MDEKPKSKLEEMPPELKAMVVTHLSDEDIFNLSLCSKDLQSIIRVDSFIRPIVLARAPYSLEAQEALETGHYARAFRRLVKRRTAISRATPYAVGLLGPVHSYKYAGGKLCYVVKRKSKKVLRILDLQRWSNWELVVDVSALLLAAREGLQETLEYVSFDMIYQEAGIVTCLIWGDPSWAFIYIIKPEEHRILETCLFSVEAQIFVRNNEKYLYFGILTPECRKALTGWVLRFFDLQKLTWLPELQLEDITAVEIGKTIGFEIIGEHFYCVTVGIIDESLYTCFRFPLSDPKIDARQCMNRKDIWRPRTRDGSFGSRLLSLSLETDEATGKVRRTYYTTEVVFKPKDDYGDVLMGGLPGSTIPMLPPMQQQLRDAHSAEYSSVDEGLSWYDEGTVSPSVRLRSGHRKCNPALSSSGSELNQEPLSTEPHSANRVFIWPPRQVSSKRDHQQASSKVKSGPRQALPEPDPSVERARRLLTGTGGVLPLQTIFGDARFIIYTTSGGSGMGPDTLTIISFDPATRLEGMECGAHIPSQPVPDVRMKSAVAGEPVESAVPDAEKGKNPSGKRPSSFNTEKGAQDKWESTPIYRSTGLAPPPIPATDHRGISWASWSKPMHVKHNLPKFFLGRETWVNKEETQEGGAVASEAHQANLLAQESHKPLLGL
ncbi:hypothetical protein F5Y17DRAFT_472724 [Xylariaceae sp. FL0594]|nr:hypothetical protein F5Y17DRAFT_472724 [Xylariaceae sp. FL0594]